MMRREEFELTANRATSTKIIFFKDLFNPEDYIGYSAIYNKIHSVAQKIIDGNNAGINLERIHTSANFTLLSARINQSERLLLIPDNNVSFNQYIAIGIVWNHKYDTHKFMKKNNERVLKFLEKYSNNEINSDKLVGRIWSQDAPTAELEEITDADADADADADTDANADANANANAKSKNHDIWQEGYYYNQSFITLFPEQEQAIAQATLRTVTERLSLPMMLTGGPGSGKTLSATIILLNYIEQYINDTVAHGQHQQIIYYIAPPYLIKSVKDELDRSVRFEQLKNKKDFIFIPSTHEQLFERFASDEIQNKLIAPGAINNTKRLCIDWIKRKLSERTDLDYTSETIYLEFKIICGYKNDIQQYKNLGKKSSLVSKKDRDKIKILFNEFIAYCNEQGNHIDPVFHRPDAVVPEAEFIIVDEAQIASSEQLHTILELSQNNHIVFIGDSAQNPDSKISSIPYIKYYYSQKGIHLSEKNFSINARSSLRSAYFVDQAIEIEKILAGKESQALERTTAFQADGGVYWLNALTDGLINEFKNKALNADCLIITNEEHLEDANKFFGGDETCNIGTSSDFLGSQAQEIVLYKFFSNKQAEQISQALQLNHPNGRKFRAKGLDNEHHAFLNKLFIALSRSTNRITIIEPRSSFNIDKLKEHLESYIDPEQPPRETKVIPRTEQQWYEAVERAARTKPALALNCLINRLGYDEEGATKYLHELNRQLIINTRRQIQETAESKTPTEDHEEKKHLEQTSPTSHEVDSEDVLQIAQRSFTERGRRRTIDRFLQNEEQIKQVITRLRSQSNEDQKEFCTIMLRKYKKTNLFEHLIQSDNGITFLCHLSLTIEAFSESIRSDNLERKTPFRISGDFEQQSIIMYLLTHQNKKAQVLLRSLLTKNTTLKKIITNQIAVTMLYTSLAGIGSKIIIDNNAQQYIIRMINNDEAMHRKPTLLLQLATLFNEGKVTLLQNIIPNTQWIQKIPVQSWLYKDKPYENDIVHIGNPLLTLTKTPHGQKLLQKILSSNQQIIDSITYDWLLNTNTVFTELLNSTIIECNFLMHIFARKCEFLENISEDCWFSISDNNNFLSPIYSLMFPNNHTLLYMFLIILKSYNKEKRKENELFKGIRYILVRFEEMSTPYDRALFNLLTTRHGIESMGLLMRWLKNDIANYIPYSSWYEPNSILECSPIKQILVGEYDGLDQRDYLWMIPVEILYSDDFLEYINHERHQGQYLITFLCNHNTADNTYITLLSKLGKQNFVKKIYSVDDFVSRIFEDNSKLLIKLLSDNPYYFDEMSKETIQRITTTNSEISALFLDIINNRPLEESEEDCTKHTGFRP